MSTRSMKKRLPFVICVALAAGTMMPASAENAPARPAAKAAERPHGAWRHHGSYTQTTQTQRTANGHTSNTVRSDAHGRTATRDATVVNDKDAGTRERDVTYTGSNGKVRTVDDDLTRTADGYERSTLVTGPNGDTATRDVDVSHDAQTHTTTKTVSVDHAPAP